MGSRLRSGYTTGACAAAAAKAAAALLLTGKETDSVNIPFPDGTRVSFQLAWSEIRINVHNQRVALAGVIKDAGDDPDVTNGALIVGQVEALEPALSVGKTKVTIIGGNGVGRVTKPGLAVPVGQPAINPVPLQMIRVSVEEAVAEMAGAQDLNLLVTISVPAGEELAKKTLNKRLGIIGGISILGTTGIVRPVSAEAWTSTISTALDVAEAAGVNEIILSTGRTSERCVEKVLHPPEEALVMMGDYLQFALLEVKKRSFSRLHMSAMWAKLLKGAMKRPQTHVRHGALEIHEIIQFLSEQNISQAQVKLLKSANTAREMLDRLRKAGDHSVIKTICRCAHQYYEHTSDTPVTIYLVESSGNLLCTYPQDDR